MSERREYDEVTKAAAMAALLTGQSVSSVAKEYQLPKGTVSGWRRQAGAMASGVAGVATQKMERIGELIIDNVEAEFETMIAMQDVFTNQKWLEKQSASELAVLYGVIKDKAIRVLEAIPDTSAADTVS